MSKSQTIGIKIKIGFGREISFVCEFSYFDWLAESHQSDANVSKSTLTTHSNFFKLNSHSESYFAVEKRVLFLASLTPVKRKHLEN